MSRFGNLTNEGLEKTEDRLGGGGFVFETDAYDATIKLAYAIQSDGGAHGVVFNFDMPDGREYRETVYITNRAGENFYLNKNDKTKKVPLPGFVTVDDICLAATEKPLSEQRDEEKIVNVWDSTEKKEMPKAVPVFVDLLGQPVTLGLIKILENKSVKNDSTGKYEATADEREANAIDKVFHTATKLTLTEVRNGKTTAEFYTPWVEKNKGVTRDKREIKGGGNAGRPAAGAPTSGPAAGGAPRSLFGTK